MVAPFRKLFSFAVTISLLLMAFSVSANQPSMGGSQWCFGKNNITGRIDLKPHLFSQIKGIKEGHYNIDSITDEQLQQMATDVLQPYIGEKLSITVNDKTYPVKVDKVTKNTDNLYTIWLSVNNVRFNHSVNLVKIVYSLLFKETKNAHTNLAFGYVTDAKGAALQKVIDYSPPVFQTTFAPNAAAWEVSIKGSMPAAGNKDERSIKP
jgi:hypothetical protein